MSLLRAFVIFVLAAGLCACDQSKSVDTPDSGTEKPANEPQNPPANDVSAEPAKPVPAVNFKQDAKHLLAGTSRAICYSGFRAGQKPGEKFPSPDEILEDLKILAEKANFQLIRIYDSGPHAEMVLEAITKNKLDIKVLLGIWLMAELSPHDASVTQLSQHDRVDQWDFGETASRVWVYALYGGTDAAATIAGTFY